MKATILYSALFATAITLIATADYSDSESRQKSHTKLTLQSKANIEDTPQLYTTHFATDTTLLPLH